MIQEAVPARRPSGPAAAEPPETIPGQGQGQGEVDRGLGPLEGPVAAGGLVADGLPDVVAGQAVKEARVAVSHRSRGAGGRGGAGCLPGGVDGSAGQEPGAGLAGEVLGAEVKAAVVKAALLQRDLPQR